MKQHYHQIPNMFKLMLTSVFTNIVEIEFTKIHSYYRDNKDK